MEKNRFLAGGILTCGILVTAVSFNILVYPSILAGATAWESASATSAVSDPVLSSQPTISSWSKYLSEEEAVTAVRAIFEKPYFSTGAMNVRAIFEESTGPTEGAIWQVIFTAEDKSASKVVFYMAVIDAQTGEELTSYNGEKTADGSTTSGTGLYSSYAINTYYENNDIFYDVIYFKTDMTIKAYEAGLTQKEFYDKFTYRTPTESADSDSNT